MYIQVITFRLLHVIDMLHFHRYQSPHRLPKKEKNGCN